MAKFPDNFRLASAAVQTNSKAGSTTTPSVNQTKFDLFDYFPLKFNDDSFLTITDTTATLSDRRVKLVKLDGATAIATVVLYSAPVIGDQILIKAIDITFNCVVNPNGEDIDGTSGNFTFAAANDVLHLAYDGTEYVVLSNI